MNLKGLKVDTTKVDTTKVDTLKVDTTKVKTTKVDTAQVNTTKVETPNDNAYAYENDLNYRDDGDELHEPSYNDIYKGYALDPYETRVYAKNKTAKHLKRKAVQEVFNAPATIDQLADYVLMLWQRVDGTLQDFFDGFTLRYPNTMKRALAKSISDKGYTIYPTLTDDRVYYANRVKSILRQASRKSSLDKVRLCGAAFANSEGLHLCLGEIEDELNIGTTVVNDEFINRLLEYYSKIFPQDFAIALTVNYLKDGTADVRIEHFQDYNLSDEALQQLERMMSGNQDPYYSVHDGGGWVGWDYVGDMRGDDGVKPERYELPTMTANKKKRLIKADEQQQPADPVGNIPLELTLDALHKGSEDIAAVIDTKEFLAPPRHIRSVRVQRNRSESHVDSAIAIDVPNEVIVYEVWSITDMNRTEHFILLSSICTLRGLTPAKWKTAEYKGFYESASEAVNAVGGFVN